MDFQKLNLEFSNMQLMIEKYNKLLLDINNKIKSNSKDINKYENKLKNVKSTLEEESYHFIVVVLKSENAFLENIIKEDNSNANN